MIIQRPALVKQLQTIKKWTFVFGRRKTGKTFLVRNFTAHNEYFYVKTDRTILSAKNVLLTYDTFVELLPRLLAQEQHVVVDEFQRLGQDFFDRLHAMEKKGKLTIISSTLFLSKKLLSAHSPLLGLFAEVQVPLITLHETLAAISSLKIPKKDMVELAVVLREPLTIDYTCEESTRSYLTTIILASKKTIPALTGEIFVEEERTSSALYDGILRSIAVGKRSTGEMASYLFARKLIQKEDASIVQQYLQNLCSFGILKKVFVFNKKKYYYQLLSPITQIFYYADEKYNLSEREPSEPELRRIIDEVMPRIIEETIREFFAQKYGFVEAVIHGADHEIDGVLLKFKKPAIAIEVKWKQKITAEDLAKTKKNLEHISAPRKILFVQDKKGIRESKEFELMDVQDLLESMKV